MPEIAPKIADDFELTEEDRQQMLPSGRQLLFYNRLAWAKFHMSKAGLFDTPSAGKFEVSELGASLLSTGPERIDIKLLRTLPKYAAFIASSAGVSTAQETVADTTVPTATPEEQIDAGYTVLQSALKADLLQKVLSQTPMFFERVIVDLLIAMGYGGTHERAALRLGKSGDGGVDGVIDEDRLGLDRIYVQAKRYAAETSVGRPDVQGFVGSLVGLGATKGV